MILLGGFIMSTSDFLRQIWKRKGSKQIASIRNLKRTIEKRYKNKTFSNFDRSKCPKAYDICRVYAKNFPLCGSQGIGLFITGAVGTGKTHLVAAIIDYIARVHKRKVYDIIFISSVNLLFRIKFSFDSKTTEALIEELEEASLLAIDDLGVEKSSDWTHEIFYKILDSRYSKQRPTILTSNFTDAELKEKMSERIVSRIYEMCNGVKITCEDYRINH